ncbi:MAG: PfkB family carbohydrate kinase [Clostridia bacterium]|jgi:pseudouridine kinase
MENGYIVVIGGINADITGKAVKDVVINESNIGKVTLSAGGVGRNICENLVRMGVDCEFITAFSNDYFGDMLKKSCNELGISIINSFETSEYATGTYVSLEDYKGQMFAAVCDSEGIMNMPISHIDKLQIHLKHSSCIVIDCNLSESMIDYISTKFQNKIIIAEAVSSAKVIKLRKSLKHIYAVKLNRQEFESLYEVEYSQENGKKMSVIYNQKIFVTEGVHGSTGYEKNAAMHIDAIPALQIVSVNGAGDAYASGIAYGIMQGYDTSYCMKLAGIMSYFTLSSTSAVSKDITKHKVITLLKETN